MSEIKAIAVLGSGTMGAGIAQVAVQAGYAVHLYDISDEIVGGAVGRIGGVLRRLAEKGKLTSEGAEAAIGRLQATSSLQTLDAVDFVIEAAPERLELKQQLFGQLDSICPAHTILATNTSTLSVTSIAASTKRPDRVVGMHFFNPPPLMPLVEVAGGNDTSKATLTATMALAEALGKTPVQSQDVPGFIVNRVARPFYLEGLRLMGEGVADAATIDRLVREGGGFRMGPFELMDLIGIDINYAASQSIFEAFFGEPRFRPHPLQRRQVESGNLGRKTGRGWYSYEK
jgi:3-hydroxybutyryl-CoA dehydrogenase